MYERILKSVKKEKLIEILCELNREDADTGLFVISRIIDSDEGKEEIFEVQEEMFGGEE